MQTQQVVIAETSCLVGKSSKCEGTVPKSGLLVLFDHQLLGDNRKYNETLFSRLDQELA